MQGVFNAPEGYRVDYLPANRGQLDAATNYVAISDLQTTRVGTLPNINRWSFSAARDPRLSPQIDYVCLRSPHTGELRATSLPTGQSVSFLGVGDDARWSADGAVITWAWGGRVYGRAGVTAVTVDLTPPGRAASHAVPVRDRATGQVFVGMVLAAGGDTGELVIVPYGSEPTMGYAVAQSAGSAFDWDLYSAGDGKIQVTYQTLRGAPARVQVVLGGPMVPVGSVWPNITPVVPTAPKIFAWFYSHGRYGDFTTEANASVLGVDLYSNNGVLPPDALPRYCAALDEETGFIAVEDMQFQAVRDRWAQVRGVWVHEPSTVAEAQAEVQAARKAIADHGLQPRPIIAVIATGQALDTSYRQTGADALAPEIYFDLPSLSYADMRVRAARMISDVKAALAGVPLYLVPQAYDRSNAQWKAHPEQLAAIESACASTLNDPQVLGLWPFSYARPGGATAYPPLESIYEAQAAVMAAPPLPVDPIPPDPPDPNPQDEMYYPNDVQMTNTMQRIADAYVNILKRVPPPDAPHSGEGIYRVPPDGLENAIPDGSRQEAVMPPHFGSVRIDTKSIAVWTGRYFNYFNQYKGDHERAVNSVLTDIRNSPEGQAANPQ